MLVYLPFIFRCGLWRLRPGTVLMPPAESMVSGAALEPCSTLDSRSVLYTVSTSTRKLHEACTVCARYLRKRVCLVKEGAPGSLVHGSIAHAPSCTENFSISLVPAWVGLLSSFFFGASSHFWCHAHILCLSRYHAPLPYLSRVHCCPTLEMLRHPPRLCSGVSTGVWMVFCSS